MTKEERDVLRLKFEKELTIVYLHKTEFTSLLDALDKAEEQIKLLDQLLSSAKSITKTIEDFCCDEMFQKNEICCHLKGRYLTATCEKCPLYQFKLHLTKEIKNG